MPAGSGLMKDGPAIPHLNTGEIADLRADVKRNVAPLVATVMDEFTNPIAPATGAIKTAFATAVTAQSFSGSALNGTVGGAKFQYPRNVTVTTAGTTPANATGAVTVTGKDVFGKPLTEVITPATTAATVAGAKMFNDVDKIDQAACAGTGATIAVGIGAILGLSVKVRPVAGLFAIKREVAIGAAVTTGTLGNPTTNPPTGGYTPAAAPNGTNDYAIEYEGDPTSFPTV